MTAPVTRTNLDARTVTIVHSARGLRPEVRVVRGNDRLLVVKDYAPCPATRRELLGRWLARREYFAYRQLAGVSGIPRPHGMIDQYAFACEFITGTCGSTFQRGELPDEFFVRLHRLVADIHAHGIAHGDLKRRRNILVAPGFQPYLVDFASAIRRRSRWDVVGNMLFRQLCTIDFNAVAKLKRRVAPHLLTTVEVRRLQFPTFLERWARRVLGR